MIRTHDDLTFEEVRNCPAVKNLSRWVPAESEAIESFEDILANADAVAEGMKYVMYEMSQRMQHEIQNNRNMSTNLFGDFEGLSEQDYKDIDDWARKPETVQLFQEVMKKVRQESDAFRARVSVSYGELPILFH